MPPTLLANPLASRVTLTNLRNEIAVGRGIHTPSAVAITKETHTAAPRTPKGMGHPPVPTNLPTVNSVSDIQGFTDKTFAATNAESNHAVDVHVGGLTSNR